MTLAVAAWLVAVVVVGGTPAAELTKQEIDSSRVVLSTQEGEIVIRLRTDAAPGSSTMFANMVRTGVYDGCSFYRAEDFCIQGGLRTAAGQARTNPYGHFPFEYGIPNTRGTVTLARWEDVNSATGEFFINLKDSHHLDRSGDSGWALGFAVFGEVESGMDVADRIAKLPTHPEGGLAMLNMPDTFGAQLRAAGKTPGAGGPVALHAVQAKPSSTLRVELGSFGFVPIALDVGAAPLHVAALEALARSGGRGNLHRVEGVPPPGSQGPPYALVQLTVDDASQTLAKLQHEGNQQIERGSVCMIGGTSDFFVSLAAHPGWEASMTIFGHVSEADLAQHVEPVLTLPHHLFTHPTFGTVMSMLDTPLALSLRMEVTEDAPTPSLRGGDSAKPQKPMAALEFASKEDFASKSFEAQQHDVEEILRSTQENLDSIPVHHESL